MKKFLKFFMGSFVALILVLVYIFYDRGFLMTSEEYYFHAKLKEFNGSQKELIYLKDLMNFEWDNVCFYYDGDINLKDQNLIKAIQFKPETMLRSKYYIDSDVVGALFANNKTKKYEIFVNFLNEEDINLLTYKNNSEEAILLNSNITKDVKCYKTDSILIIKK